MTDDPRFVLDEISIVIDRDTFGVPDVSLDVPDIDTEPTAYVGYGDNDVGFEMEISESDPSDDTSDATDGDVDPTHACQSCGTERHVGSITDTHIWCENCESVEQHGLLSDS